MSGKTPERSDIIDVTYHQLHSILCGQTEGYSAAQVEKLLLPRINQLQSISEPFGKPSAASRKKIDSGSITLADGVVQYIEEADKAYIYAVSSAFDIDEVQAFILLRSFLYDQAVTFPDGIDSDKVKEDTIETFTPFYYSERLSVLRILIPLFRAKAVSEPFHALFLSILPQVLRDSKEYEESLLAEYEVKLKEKIPEKFSKEPKAVARWVKQNSKEQLVLLEVLFWTLFESVTCDGPTVEKIIEMAYETDLGSLQQNANLLLDEEGTQLTQDKMALWILITLEVLELEKMTDSATLQISDHPTSSDLYFSFPNSLERIHQIVTANSENKKFSCTYLAWTFVVSRLASVASELPDSYRGLLDSLLLRSGSYSKEREPSHVIMSRKCLDPQFGLFSVMSALLTTSPLFSTKMAWRTASAVTDPNAVAFRSVFKGLVIALVELIPVELIPEFDSFVDVWIALFGKSESKSIAGICTQYWQIDWHRTSRRAVIDVARSRFPIQCGPLIKLLAAMTASGSLDSESIISEERELCTRHVFYFLDRLPSYSQVVPASACTGAQALYEKQIEQYGSSTSSANLTYTNLRPVYLPGGSLLPAGSKGRLLNGDGSDYLVVCWKHEHSGWRFLLEVLTEYLSLRNSGPRRAFKSRKGGPEVCLSLSDIGFGLEDGVDELLVTDILKTIRSLIQDNPSQAEQLMQSLEYDSNTSSADLVELTTGILEEALSRSNSPSRTPPLSHLITSALGVLSAILAIPNYCNRVWIYLKSTSVLFGSDKTSGFATAALAIERLTGHYDMTLSLLRLVQQLCYEASLLLVPHDNDLRKLKDEVLIRAFRFVHTEIWVEHLGWKYAQLGDRFEIGRHISLLYLRALQFTPKAVTESPFPRLSKAVLDLLLFRASTLTMTPLVSVIASGGQMFRMLHNSRRLGDAQKLALLLQSYLTLARSILERKVSTEVAAKPCLLEQVLCGQVTGGASSHASKGNPIDALAFYVKQRDAGTAVPLGAIRLLSSLCISLSMSKPTPSTIVAHLSDPEAVVSYFVRIVEHPFDDLTLRYSVWRFIILAMDKEPALARLFVAGQFRTATSLDLKGKGRETDAIKEAVVSTSRVMNAIDVARDTVANWEQLWESNPLLLATVLIFLQVVWRHGLEHKSLLEPLRRNDEFWHQITALACSELGPVPPFETETFVIVDGKRRADVHDAVAGHCYRVSAKAFALRIIGLDIGIHLQSAPRSEIPSKPTSFTKIEPRLRSQDDLIDLVSEATPNSYIPDLYDNFSQLLTSYFANLSASQLEFQTPLDEREYGDEFSFSMDLLRSRLHAYRSQLELRGYVDVAERQLSSINLNMSLAHSQTALTESWQFFLGQVVPYLGGDDSERPILLSIAASVSFDIMRETRVGDMAATIHGVRLSLLLAICELVWFSTTERPHELKSFVELVDNLRGIVLNEFQPPSKSIQGSLTVPFHPQLLQLLYFCTKGSRTFTRRPKALNADQRLRISMSVDAIQNLVISALGMTFMSARGRADIDLDRDMELLVAVFEQCTRLDISPSSTQWLARYQETDIGKASLELYVQVDLVGLSDLSLLVAKKRPLYAPHLLRFHMALASISTAAERFANDGVLSAYSNNNISKAASAGRIDATIPELPGERSPAHQAYCSMLAIVSGIVGAMGRNNHYFDAETCGFIQLYGDQIARSLSWTTADAITLPLLEEIEQVVHLFNGLALNAPPRNVQPPVENVLRVFTPLALNLLQQLNYALTHPNHLASLFEPITSEDRILLEKGASIPDAMKRPLVAYLMHRLFQLSSNIIFTLICISKAETVLTGEQADWLVHEALVIPHSKVVLGEHASIGTLLELGNGTLDMLRNLINLPAGQSIATLPVAAVKGGDIDVRQGVATTRRNLENVLVYAVTQLAMWLSKPEFDVPSNDMETEELTDTHKESTKDRRAPRSSLVLGDRIRRGMTGEMAADLQSLLNKAKPIIAKSNTVLGKEQIDLTAVLSTFLQERIILSTS
ncbi:hypothetical protein K435DRAFT_743696 [Dendrothele bispora CBS 962.96]|uniref:Nucleoporin Nup188 N-terminal subdomain III domain-containing protein n=1 Tax=Dendrothele bispora (strain CBS 962.96) TaxID=1314807 RepID=A0A4S8MU58_DENBC|nr:hypothetical protein K435DRAFT_743696 [Dendrothele bispora CBS 962.96]